MACISGLIQVEESSVISCKVQVCPYQSKAPKEWFTKQHWEVISREVGHQVVEKIKELDLPSTSNFIEGCSEPLKCEDLKLKYQLQKQKPLRSYVLVPRNDQQLWENAKRRPVDESVCKFRNFGGLFRKCNVIPAVLLVTVEKLQDEVEETYEELITREKSEYFSNVKTSTPDQQAVLRKLIHEGTLKKKNKNSHSRENVSSSSGSSFVSESHQAELLSSHYPEKKLSPQMERIASRSPSIIRSSQHASVTSTHRSSQNSPHKSERDDREVHVSTSSEHPKIPLEREPVVLLERLKTTKLHSDYSRSDSESDSKSSSSSRKDHSANYRGDSGGESPYGTLSKHLIKPKQASDSIKHISSKTSPLAWNKALTQQSSLLKHKDDSGNDSSSGTARKTLSQPVRMKPYSEPLTARKSFPKKILSDSNSSEPKGLGYRPFKPEVLQVASKKPSYTSDESESSLISESKDYSKKLAHLSVHSKNPVSRLPLHSRDDTSDEEIEVVNEAAFETFSKSKKKPTSSFEARNTLEDDSSLTQKLCLEQARGEKRYRQISSPVKERDTKKLCTSNSESGALKLPSSQQRSRKKDTKQMPFKKTKEQKLLKDLGLTDDSDSQSEEASTSKKAVPDHSREKNSAAAEKDKKKGTSSKDEKDAVSPITRKVLMIEDDYKDESLISFRDKKHPLKRPTELRSRREKMSKLEKDEHRSRDETVQKDRSKGGSKERSVEKEKPMSKSKFAERQKEKSTEKEEVKQKDKSLEKGNPVGRDKLKEIVQEKSKARGRSRERSLEKLKPKEKSVEKERPLEEKDRIKGKLRETARPNEKRKLKEPMSRGRSKERSLESITELGQPIDKIREKWRLGDKEKQTGRGASVENELITGWKVQEKLEDIKQKRGMTKEEASSESHSLLTVPTSKASLPPAFPRVSAETTYTALNTPLPQPPSEGPSSDIMTLEDITRKIQECKEQMHSKVNELSKIVPLDTSEYLSSLPSSSTDINLQHSFPATLTSPRKERKKYEEYIPVPVHDKPMKKRTEEYIPRSVKSKGMPSVQYIPTPKHIINTLTASPTSNFISIDDDEEEEYDPMAEGINAGVKGFSQKESSRSSSLYSSGAFQSTSYLDSWDLKSSIRGNVPYSSESHSHGGEMRRIGRLSRRNPDPDGNFRSSQP